MGGLGDLPKGILLLVIVMSCPASKPVTNNKLLLTIKNPPEQETQEAEKKGMAKPIRGKILIVYSLSPGYV